jgi:hypothetical protein
VVEVKETALVQFADQNVRVLSRPPKSTWDRAAELKNLHLKCGICSSYSSNPKERAQMAVVTNMHSFTGAGYLMTTREAMGRIRTLRLSAVLGSVLLCSASSASGYSVLTHEAIIDSTWDSAIRPLLLKRFPLATAEELTHAHAYAYGGCIIQDLGYYPFGGKFFSDLTHYVRSGDFILNLIRDSQDINEYAFAFGALSHYAADNNGHSMAVNRAVPLFYPKLGVKFGTLVTYADDPFSHSKTEFAFDVFQAAKGRYASAAYKSFIGFEVAKPLLERAFEDNRGHWGAVRNRHEGDLRIAKTVLRVKATHAVDRTRF